MKKNSGATWIEYVIVTALIALALLAAVLFFGRDVLNMFGVAGQATTGKAAEACQMQGAAVEDAKSEKCEAAGRRAKNAAAAEASARRASRDAETHAVESAEVDVPLPSDDDDLGRDRSKR